MYKDSLSKKLIDVMGNLALESEQKAYVLLEVLDKQNPEEQLMGMKKILECYGLCPRHETDQIAPSFAAEDVQKILVKNQAKVDHQIKGWFEINSNQPIEKTLSEMCYFFQNFLDPIERAVVFNEILKSKHIPINVNFFSKHVDEESDNLLLREYASEYIQMRQLLNLNVGSTGRGSLILDFIQHLDEHKQAILLGAFVDELLRRLKGKKTSASSSAHSAPNMTMPFGMPPGFDMSGDPEQLKEMMKKMQSILPPEVLEQLKKLFKDLGDDNKF